MDELAYALDMDPIELRIKNEPAMHPELGVPFSERRLVECMREGARRFGWDRRPKRAGECPRWTMADRLRYGRGDPSALPVARVGQSSARGRRHRGRAIRHDRHRDRDVHDSHSGRGRGAGTAARSRARRARRLQRWRPAPARAARGARRTTCTALDRACRALRDKVLAEVGDEERTPAADLAALVAKHFPDGVEAIGSVKSMMEEPNFKAYSLNSFGAHFAEVHVDMDTGEVRLRRMLGVFDAGRIFNAKTARSQLIGGMTWGVSMALHEEGVVDTRTGEFVNRDFAQYLVPVHADIPAIDAILLDSFDDKANELGAKGLGEVGVCGSGAAVANAVYNATGVRVRDFPITIEKLLPGLPSDGHPERARDLLSPSLLDVWLSRVSC